MGLKWWPFVWRRRHEALIVELGTARSERTELEIALSRAQENIARLHADLERVHRFGWPIDPAETPGPPPRATPLSVREADEAAMRRLRGEANRHG